MARKKKAKKLPPVVKPLGLGFLAIVIIFLIGMGIVTFAKNSSYFKVRTIFIDPALHFIDKRDVSGLKGKCIFEIDLEKTQKTLQFKYPQVSQLKVVKRFPDQILVVAKKRLPYVRTILQNRTLTLDDEGVVLSHGKRPKPESNLPLILGLASRRQNFSLGYPLKGKDIDVALKILKTFDTNRSLSGWRVSKINVGTLSKIQIFLSNGLSVIIDQDKIEHRIKVLAVFLSQGQLDIKDTRYIDLRFKEPVIGKK